MKKKVTIGILLSAGKGKRMGAGVSKQYMELCGHPVIYYALKAFEESEVDYIVMVVGAGEEKYIQKEIIEKYRFTKVKKLVTGGKERYNSVYNGLKCIEELEGENEASEKQCNICESEKIESNNTKVDNIESNNTESNNTKVNNIENENVQDVEEKIVLIHDGARAFIAKEEINHIIEETKIHKACVAAVKSKDTVKIADEDGYIAYTPNRKDVWNIQTPQAFEYNIIKQAYDKIIADERYSGIITDDAMVLENANKEIKIKLIECSYDNIKITTPEDIIIGQSILARRQ